MTEHDTSGRIGWRFVSDPAQLREAVVSLMDESLIGLDTETYWDRATNRQHVALVQIAPSSGDVLVVDVLSTGVEPLKPLMESPEVKMVAHNARFDEGVLRGEGVGTAGLIDTLRMSRMALTLASHSLASVAEHLLGLPVDKTLQNSNWRRRPLTRSQIEYAALDARVVLQVYEELRLILTEQGRLEVALAASEITPGQTGGARKKRMTTAVPEILLTPEEKRVVVCLKKWRLERSMAQRVPAYMICADRTLEHLARARPDSLESLASIFGLGESKIRTFGEELLRALRDASE